MTGGPLFRLRNRLLASPRFHRFANAFWPTRLLARRSARRLFDVVAGFTYSQVLFACVKLGLFEALADGPRTPGELAGEHGLSVEAMHDLLAAAAAIGLLEKTAAETFGLGPLGAVMVRNESLRAMVLHHEHFYRDMLDPIALLGDRHSPTAVSRYWPYAGEGSGTGVATEDAARYSALMSASQPMIAEQVLAAYSFTRHRRLLDIGGGEGGFLRAVADRAPHLELMLFDLPPVVELARRGERLAPVFDRVTFYAGDFSADALPEGADIVSLVRILHDHDDDLVLTLLAAIRRVLPDDGVLLIAEPLAGTRGAEAFSDVYFRFYLRAMGTGRPRTVDELGRLLSRAGFVAPQQHRTRLPMLTGLLTTTPARRMS